jgi:hydroxyacylglutathione hydrolase
MPFCGDTLFARLRRASEGTPERLYASLEKPTALPDETLVYCGHEYHENIGFAKTVEPDAALLEREAMTPAAARQPAHAASTIAREKATNP